MKEKKKKKKKKKKRKREESALPLPVLPDSIRKMFGENTRDDPENHQGRKRNFAHVPGNWPTHVYIQVAPSPPLLRVLTSVREQAQAEWPDFNWHWFAPEDNELHISLSRTVALRENQIVPFVDHLRGQLETCSVAAFDANLTMARGLELFTNDEHTRSFVSLPVHKGKTQLCELIKAVDATFRCFGLQAYYKDPSPHTSLAWALGNAKPSKRARQSESKEAASSATTTNLTDSCSSACSVVVPVSAVQCKVGNKLYEFNLVAD